MNDKDESANFPVQDNGYLSALRTLRRVVAPSWVMPADMAENCRFLAGKVDEAGLMLLESETCLNYGKDDLPEALSDLPLDYHVHLPLDLPWHDPVLTAGVCRELMARCTYLADKTKEGRCGGIAGVLHPPAADNGGDRQKMLIFLRCYEREGGDPSLLMLENIPENDLSGLEDQAIGAGLGLCLDLGHLLACGQERLLRRTALLERVRMLHLSAPGLQGGRIAHLPLTELDAAGREAGLRLCSETPENATIMPELFSWQELEQSLAQILLWLQPLKI